MSRGHLLVVIGPSGSGKGTVLKKVLAQEQNTFYSVSATTRSPREGEQNGTHYYFLSHDEFQKLVSEDGLLEYACYVGNFYGTPRKPVLERIEAGQNVILEIEIQGAKQVREKYPEAVLLFILPPTLEELRRRLLGRGTETEDVVDARLQKAAEEIGFARECDYVVVNDTVELAAGRICQIIDTLSSRTRDMLPVIKRILCGQPDEV